MNPQQPRLPDGRYWFLGMPKGWYKYVKRNGDIASFYNNNIEQMESGFAVLGMAAHGKTNEGAGGNPYERIHLTSTDDGEQLMYAASENGAFGVINHSQPGPDADMSCIRRHDYLPVPNKLPEDATAMGGSMAVDSGKGHPIIDAKRNEEVNRTAFEKPNAKVYTIDPQDLAQAQVEARHEYERMGLTDAEARKAPVYVYVDKDGVPQSRPVYHRNSDGELVKRRSPNTHGGSNAVMLDGDDVTRMSRAMEREGLTDVDVTISQGTTPRRNALHFRADYENETTRDSVTMWGSVERNNAGTVVADAGSPTSDSMLRASQNAHIRSDAAKKFENPDNVEDATRLMRQMYNGSERDRRYIRTEDVALKRERDSNGDMVQRVVLHDSTGDVDEIYNGSGVRIRSDARTSQGFAQVYNPSRPPAMRVDPQDVNRLDDGNFMVTRSVKGDDGNVRKVKTIHKPDGRQLSERIAIRRYGEEIFD